MPFLCPSIFALQKKIGLCIHSFPHSIIVFICFNRPKGRGIYPKGIKKHGTPSPADISAFKIWGTLEKPGFGCELCLAGKIQPLDRDVLALSIWDI
jgi:hypothetical protein